MLWHYKKSRNEVMKYTRFQKQKKSTFYKLKHALTLQEIREWSNEIYNISKAKKITFYNLKHALTL